MFKPSSPPSVKPCSLQEVSFWEYADLVEGDAHLHPWHRFLSLMRKMGARTLTEEPGTHPEVGREDDSVSKKLGLQVASSVHRFSFFRSRFRTPEEVEDQSEDALLGYAIVARTPEAGEQGSFRVRVYEAVVRAPKLLNNHLHVLASFPTHVGAKRFTLQGTWFSEPSGVTGVCAHGALLMALRHLLREQGIPVTYDDLNRRGAVVKPEGGLSPEEIRRIATSYGLSTKWYGVDKMSAPWFEYAYPFIESGYPVMLGFACSSGPAAHVVLAVGHTLNSDLWLPEAHRLYFRQVPPVAVDVGVISNTLWVDYFIVQDTNYGMYLNLDPRSLGAQGQHGGPVQGVLCFQPMELQVDVGTAKTLAQLFHWIVANTYDGLLSENNVAVGERARLWLRELHRTHRPEKDRIRAPVFRLLLVQRGDYLRHLFDSQDRQGNFLDLDSQYRLHQLLPELFWLVEVTLPDLYTVNRTKLADIVIPAASALPFDVAGLGKMTVEQVVGMTFGATIYARFPGFELLRQEGAANLSVTPCPIEDHVRLFEHPSSPAGIPVW